jgi:hypothetical protein
MHGSDMKVFKYSNNLGEFSEGKMHGKGAL